MVKLIFYKISTHNQVNNILLMNKISNMSKINWTWLFMIKKMNKIIYHLNTLAQGYLNKDY